MKQYLLFKKIFLHHKLVKAKALPSVVSTRPGVGAEVKLIRLHSLK